jgi:hypothetical protein
MPINRYSRLLMNFRTLFEQKEIINTFKNFTKPERPIHLGRWSIPKVNEKYDYDKIHKNANMANYDHCDPCGREFTPKNFDKNIK